MNSNNKESKENENDKVERYAGNWIESYIKHAEGQESPQLFHLWVAISTVSAVLRRNVYLDMGYFRIFPNFYMILVSPSGTCRKGIALSMGEKFLDDIDGINIYRNKLTPEFLLQYLKDEASSHDVKDDNGDMVTEERSQATLIVPELTTMLGSASYASDLKITLTDLFDGKRSNDYGTKGKGKLRISNVNINFIGASNPTWLAKSFTEDAFGGGFMGRIIFVYQDKGKKVAWPEKDEATKTLEKMLLLDLQHISRVCGNFKVTVNARDFVTEWYESFEPEVGTRMSGYFERKQIHLLKLGMVLSISESDSLILREKHCEDALSLLDQIEAWMPDAFAFIGATLEAQIEQRIIDLMNSNGGYSKEKNLLKSVRKDLKGKREFDNIMYTLRASGTVQKMSYEGEIYFAMQWYIDKKAKELKEQTREENKRKKNTKKEEEEEDA